MKNIAFVLLWSVTAPLGFGQAKVFSGKFDHQFQLRLHLMIEGKKVGGYALHQKTHKKRALTGKKDRKDRFTLSETDASGNETGSYELELFANYLLKGTYTSGGTTTDLILKAVPEKEVTTDEDFLDQQLAILAKWRENDRKHIKEIMGEFLACTSQQKPVHYCDRFIAMAYFHLHGYDDFGYGKEASEFLPETDISKELEKNAMWNKRGFADDEKLLQKAIKWASTGIPVLAVKHLKGESSQVALIVPGAGSLSGKWGEKRVPHATVFLTDQPGLSFSNRPLSQAWSTPSEIEIWVRDGEISD